MQPSKIILIYLHVVFFDCIGITKGTTVNDSLSLEWKRMTSLASTESVFEGSGMEVWNVSPTIAFPSATTKLITDMPSPSVFSSFDNSVTMETPPLQMSSEHQFESLTVYQITPGDITATKLLLNPSSSVVQQFENFSSEMHSNNVSDINFKESTASSALMVSPTSFPSMLTPSHELFLSSEKNKTILSDVTLTSTITSGVITISSQSLPSFVENSTLKITVSSKPMPSSSSLDLFTAMPSKSSSDSSTPNHYTTPFLVTTPIPVNVSRRKYMVMLQATDCPELTINQSTQILSRWLSSFGFSNVSVGITDVRCHSQLNINISVDLLHHASQDHVEHILNNSSVFVLNRTFQVIDIQNLITRSDTGTNSTTISVVTKNEFNAYIAVGVSFGLVLVICISVCCAKCWARPNQRLGALRSSHMPLRPEDYTLTPIPRPSSLYVDYYRGSITGDLYSNASAGSIASTSPTTEKGIIQPFDTSIVPLEDTSVPTETTVSKNEVAESKDSKPFSIQTAAGQGLMYCNASADSTERLNPRQSRSVDSAVAGVPNPTFQRF